MEMTLSTKDVLYNISSMKNFAIQLLEQGKDYDELLSFICKQDYYNEDVHLPTLKEIQEELGISYSVLKRQLINIYNDLYEHHTMGIEFLIQKTEYWFSMRYFDNYARVIVNKIPRVPRVGEYIDFPFFSAKVGTSSFYVQRIHHYLSDSKQIIEITLNPGMYNYYWRMRKDEAFLKGQITWDEYWDHMDYDAKEKLKLPKYS